MKRIILVLTTVLLAPITLFAKYGRDWDMYDTPRDNDGMGWFWAIVIFGLFFYSMRDKKDKNS